MIPLFTDAQAFSAMIDDWVVAAVSDGAVTFTDVVSSLPGVFPVNVLESITRVANLGQLPRNALFRLNLSLREKSLIEPPPAHSILPVPHPLDFEWRFTKEAIEKLVEVASGCGRKVICLGTPSVFTDFFSDSRNAPDCTFVDRNSATLSVLRHRGFGRVVACDCLRDPVPQLATDVVIADPPWYDEHFKGFLWMAAQVCSIDGFLILSLPPDGTRLTAREEITSILGYASRLGFVLKQFSTCQLPYETPQFEKNVLRQAGILCDLGPWRKGTLAVFQKARASYTQRPFAPADEKWLEASLFGTRIKLRDQFRLEGDDPRLSTIVHGDVLPSVSRAAQMRQDVDVWTSGNRIFRCDGPLLLHRIIQEVADGSFDWKNVDSAIRIPRDGRGTPIQWAATQVCEIAYSEKCERQRIGNG